MKNLGVALCAAVVVTSCSPATEAPKEQFSLAASTTGVVSRVVDGDTVHVVIAGADQTVQVLGVDAPDLLDPRRSAGQTLSCGAAEAAQFAHERLDGQTIRLTADPTQQDSDIYHRRLRYITLADGSDYSIEIAKAGLARNYVFANKPVQKNPQIVAAQQQAQSSRLGLWGSVCAQSTPAADGVAPEPGTTYIAPRAGDGYCATCHRALREVTPHPHIFGHRGHHF